jgi:hypothetical protein
VPVARRDQLTTQVAKDFAAHMREETERECLAERGKQVQTAFDVFVIAFTRSKSGNLWRQVQVYKDGATIETLTLTVFQRDGTWRLCAADKSGPYYGQSDYNSEDDALTALWWGLRAHYGPECELV